MTMQSLAFILPLPVTVALAFFLLVLLALSIVVLSLRKPAPVCPPARRDDAPQGRSCH